MTRMQLATVLAEGVSFSINLADGRPCKVPHRDYVSLPPEEGDCRGCLRERRNFTWFAAAHDAGVKLQIGQKANCPVIGGMRRFQDTWPT